ncbi:M20 family metallo-hydrolase [Endozoicomonas acroporae]|uniref:M20 family metallo-hydrolase n=1 Tax=Endozoicomonas acroporae TaxID=1701104 RepID=UPI003D7AB92E
MKEQSRAKIILNRNNCFNSGSNVISQCQELSKITEVQGELTRTYFTQSHNDCNELVGFWMKMAGMKVSYDEIGNVIGTLKPVKANDDNKIFVMGSHLDTVTNAGKYDGVLGVLTAIEAISSLVKDNIDLPYTVKVIGFSNEEGVRFPIARTGSKAIAGILDNDELQTKDRQGRSFSSQQQSFINNSCVPIVPVEILEKNLIGFLEVHIEQGPVLYRKDLPLGIVTSIQGADRYTVTISGIAGHAGTVPLAFRKDAMHKASILINRLYDLSHNNDFMLTVGRIKTHPDSTNTIAGEVTFTIDARSDNDFQRRERIGSCIDQFISDIEDKGMTAKVVHNYSSDTSICDHVLNDQLSKSMKKIGIPHCHLKSGAGHDALSFHNITPIAMIFVRCFEGLSHVPEEDVNSSDIEKAVNLVKETLISLGEK